MLEVHFVAMQFWQVLVFQVSNIHDLFDFCHHFSRQSITSFEGCSFQQFFLGFQKTHLWYNNSESDQSFLMSADVQVPPNWWTQNCSWMWGRGSLGVGLGCKSSVSWASSKPAAAPNICNCSTAFCWCILPSKDTHQFLYFVFLLWDHNYYGTMFMMSHHLKRDFWSGTRLMLHK